MFRITKGSVYTTNVWFNLKYSTGEISGEHKDSYNVNSKTSKQTITRKYKINGELDRVNNNIKININGTWTVFTQSPQSSYTVVYDMNTIINGTLKENGNIVGEEKNTIKIIKPAKNKFVYKYGQYYINKLVSYTPDNFTGINEKIDDWLAEPKEK